jgi:hypothetical protein
MQTGRLLAAFVLVANLSGCVSYDRVWNHGGYFTDAQSSAFRFSGADRDFRTSVVGNPFDGPRAETEQAVIAAMQGQDKGMRTNFTLTPRSAYKNNHIVMMFNPPGYRAEKGACRTSGDHSGRNTGGKMVLAAIYCDGDRLVYAVAVSRDAVKSPNDPQFRRFVSELMDFFVPRYSMIDDVPNEGDEDN